MSRSILLQLARDSIEEVLQAQNTIDKKALLNEHPLLNENIQADISIYIDDKLKSSYSSTKDYSLLNNIIIGAKKAAFEDKTTSPITTAEYLSCEIELSLQTIDGIIKQKDEPILKES